MDFSNIDFDYLQRIQTEHRRSIHMYPENAWTEFRTTSLIIDKLEEFGIPYLYGKNIHTKGERYGLPSDEYFEMCYKRAIDEGADPERVEKMKGGYTGVIGILDTGRPGPKTALRFDIDCIDAIETSDPEHVPNREGFASKHQNLFHGCGHDAHNAIGIGVAYILKQNIDKLCGKILLVFQPGEEGLRGGNSMADSGLFDDVDYIFAGHVGGKPMGVIVTGASGFAISQKFDLHFDGVPSHAGAAPEVGHNALLAAANAAINIMAISRTSQGFTRVNVGTLNAGTGRNVIPSIADMKCEVRGETQEACDYMAERLLEVAEGAAKMQGCEFSYKIVGKASGANCDEELNNITAEAAKITDGVISIVPAGQKKGGGSEDFTTLMHKVQEHGGKATFFMIASNSNYPNHHDHFDIDEKCLPLGSRVFCNMTGIINGIKE